MNRNQDRRGNWGQGLTEYLMLLMLISVVAIGVTSSLGGQIKTKIETITRQIRTGITVDGQ